MASKKISMTKPTVKSAGATKQRADTDPVFPYTNKPGSLRRFLQEVPKRPKPAKFDKNVLKSWGFTDTNDMSILRVLKAVGLLGSSNEPTSLYTQFMSMNGGAAHLAKPMRELYAPLFTASHTPYKESSETLKNLFNIHSGGSPKTLEFQIQTFKALAESTSFEQAAISGEVSANGINSSTVSVTNTQIETPVPVHINLHIHLPDNKTRRDYEAIIEDIGRYIFGKNSGESN